MCKTTDFDKVSNDSVHEEHIGTQKEDKPGSINTACVFGRNKSVPCFNRVMKNLMISAQKDEYSDCQNEKKDKLKSNGIFIREICVKNYILCGNCENFMCLVSRLLERAKTEDNFQKWNHLDPFFFSSFSGFASACC